MFPYTFLQLEDVAVKTADSADDKVKEDCCPGKPFITFYTEVRLK